VTSETYIRKEKDSSENYLPHSTTTLTPHSDGAGIALTETLETGKQPAAIITERVRIVNMEREPTLTKAQIASINECKRRQAKAKGQSNTGTACFAADTFILAIKSCRASWIPIWTARKGDRVVQSLPSGRIEDLSRALTTTIKTLCSFECPDAKMDLVQMGEAYVTAHHNIHTSDGWMTARQASHRGLGKLWTNQEYQ